MQEVTIGTFVVSLILSCFSWFFIALAIGCGWMLATQGHMPLLSELNRIRKERGDKKTEKASSSTDVEAQRAELERQLAELNRK